MNYIEALEIESKKDLEKYGSFFIIKESTDCDHCTITSCTEYKDWKTFEKSMKEDYEWAEGPINYSLSSKEEAEEFEPGFKDRVMENFENGRGSSHILH